MLRFEHVGVGVFSERALEWIRQTLADHPGEEGVWFDVRARATLGLRRSSVPSRQVAKAQPEAARHARGPM